MLIMRLPGRTQAAISHTRQLLVSTNAGITDEDLSGDADPRSPES